MDLKFIEIRRGLDEKSYVNQLKNVLKSWQKTHFWVTDGSHDNKSFRPSFGVRFRGYGKFILAKNPFNDKKKQGGGNAETQKTQFNRMVYFLPKEGDAEMDNSWHNFQKAFASLARGAGIDAAYEEKSRVACCKNLSIYLSNCGHNLCFGAWKKSKKEGLLDHFPSEILNSPMKYCVGQVYVENHHFIKNGNIIEHIMESCVDPSSKELVEKRANIVKPFYLHNDVMEFSYLNGEVALKTIFDVVDINLQISMFCFKNTYDTMAIHFLPHLHNAYISRHCSVKLDDETEELLSGDYVAPISEPRNLSFSACGSGQSSSGSGGCRDQQKLDDVDDYEDDGDAAANDDDGPTQRVEKSHSYVGRKFTTRSNHPSNHQSTKVTKVATNEDDKPQQQQQQQQTSTKGLEQSQVVSNRLTKSRIVNQKSPAQKKEAPAAAGKGNGGVKRTLFKPTKSRIEIQSTNSKKGKGKKGVYKRNYETESECEYSDGNEKEKDDGEMMDQEAVLDLINNPTDGDDDNDDAVNPVVVANDF
jgi:hypothetical protein